MRHYGFRIVTKASARPSDLFLRPLWGKAKPSIPVETSPGVMRDSQGNPLLSRLRLPKSTSPLMKALVLKINGEAKQIKAAQDQTYEVQFNACSFAVTVEANTFRRGAKIRIEGLLPEIHFVQKCGSLHCENLMAVPQAFWGKHAISLIVDPVVYLRTDRRSGFHCWDCWVPRNLRQDGFESIDLSDDRETKAAWKSFHRLDKKIKRARSRRPDPDVWFAT